MDDLDEFDDQYGDEDEYDDEDPSMDSALIRQ